MKTIKNLFLLCDSYPISHGEYFLDDEINLLSGRFEKIYVLTTASKSTNVRESPSNIINLSYSSFNKYRFIKYSFNALFSTLLWKDFMSSKKYFGIKRNFKTFKVVFADYVYASEIQRQILLLCHLHSIELSETVFYSYWHDKKALALALLKCKKPNIKAVARGHGWDVDYIRHAIPFLPFKSFIIQKLDWSISISSFGQKLLKNVSAKEYHNNICVSRLGKLNHRTPLIQKVNENQFLICSCSSLIPLKRVHLIMDLIKSMSRNFNLHWVHFGDGQLSKEINSKAVESKISFELRGNVENSSILDFYSNNYVDLFINMSEFEGIPVSIMEAQSAGIPVLASDIGGNSEIVNNENGFIIGKEINIDEVDKLISSFFNSEQDKICEKRTKSYENWKQNYEAKKNYLEFSELYLSKHN